MHRTLRLVYSALAATVLLTACLMPERFSAKITVYPDASYSYRFAGTVVNPMALLKQRQQGVLSRKEQEGLAAEAQKLGQDPDVKKAIYLGNSRYTLEMDGKRSAGDTLRLLDMFTVSSDEQGLMTIAAKPLEDKERRNLAQLGIHVDGTLRIKLPPNAEVISHNASTTPTLGLGSYRWKMGSLDHRPAMQIRFKP